MSIIEKTKKIKAIVFDVDGVLTDGGIIYDNTGMEIKRFNVKDGQIISHLKKAGFIVGAITGRDEEIAYIGDDIIDLSILTRCGLSATLNDVRAYIKENVDLILPTNGGDGVLRDLADYILQEQGLLKDINFKNIEIAIKEIQKIKDLRAY